MWFLDRAESIIRLIGVRFKIIRPRKFSDLKGHLLEGFFISLVAIGVGMEVCSLPFSLNVSASANKLAGKAYEHAANTDSNNLVLQKQVLEASNKLENVEFRLLPRAFQFDWVKFMGELKGKPKMRAELLYPEGDTEAFNLAQRIDWGLKFAGWEVIDFRPAREDDIPPGYASQGFIWPELKDAPITARMGANGGALWLITKYAQPSDQAWRTNNAFGALQFSLMKGGTGQGGAGINWDPRLPDDVVEIVVGGKW